MAETAIAIESSGSTGMICQKGGPYRSSRNAKVVVFVKPGDKFPPDPDGKATTWSMMNEDLAVQ